MDQDSSKQPSKKSDPRIYETPSSRFDVSSGVERRRILHPYEPGSTIANRYHVQREIGVGGMCTVYLVSVPNRSESSLALKVVTGETNPVRLETLANEFRILAHLDHENLIRVFDFGVLPETTGFFYTAEYIEGENLIEAASETTEDTLIDYFAQVCRALEYVHARGYIHYDVKPKNLLVRQDGLVKLMDFGLSALSERGLGRRVRGTPAYTAPEIITVADVDARADLYSLGVTLYEIVAGTLPFPKRDLHGIFHAHVTEPPTPLRSLGPDIPEYLESVIMRLLAKNPADRFDSANAVIEALAKGRGIEIELQPESSAEGYLRIPPLCGRDDEMQAVRSALDRLADRRGGNVLIEGLSGHGCSRLLREIHFEAQVRGFATAFGNAGDDDVFEKLGGELALHPKVEPPPSSQKDAGLQPVESGTSLPDAVAGIVAVAEETPVVMGIDDVHTAPPLIRAALKRLTQMLAASDPPSLLLVTTWHDTEGEKASANPETTRFRLRPLSFGEVGEVATRMFGRIPAPDLFVTRLLEATGGIPHALVETLRMLVASGEIAVIEGKWLFRGGAKPFDIPQTLAGFYANQVAALGWLSQGIALNIALLDRPVAMAEISAIHNESAKQIAAALADLEHRGIIRRTNGRVAIANQGIRDALRASRSRLTIRRRHKRIGERLAGIDDREVSNLEIARHFLLGSEFQEGLQHGLLWIEAGEVEKDRTEAVSVLEQLREISQKSSRPKRAKILFALAEALGTRDDPKATIKVIEEFFSIVSRKESAKRLAQIYRYAAECYEALNRPKDTYKAWSKAVELAEPGSPDHLEALFTYAVVLDRRGRFAEAEKLLLDAVERFGEEKNYGMILVYISLVQTAIRQGMEKAVTTYAECALKLAREIGVEEQPRLVNVLAVAHMNKNDYDEAEKYFVRARRLALEQNDFHYLEIVNNNLTSFYFKRGRIDEALQAGAEAETIMRRYGNFLGLAHLYSIFGLETGSNIGRSTGVAYLIKGLEYARAAGSAATEHRLLRFLGEALLLSGNFAAAIRYTGEAISLTERNKVEASFEPLQVRANALALAGNLAEALQSTGEGLQLTLEGGDVETILTARRGVCNVAMFAGDFGLALEQIDHLERAIPAATGERRTNMLQIMADFWFRVGQLVRVSEVQCYITAEPEITQNSFDRGMHAIMTGKVATFRHNFKDAEAAFRTANHLISMDRGALTFLGLRHAEFELELFKRDTEAARSKLEDLEAIIAALPSESMYYNLLAQHCRAQVALSEGDRAAAYRDAMNSMHEARGAGYRPLQVSVMKIAAETSHNREEAEDLHENAELLAAELAEPFNESIRESVRKHFLSPLHKVGPF